MNMDINFLQAQQLKPDCNMPLRNLEEPKFHPSFKRYSVMCNLTAAICSKHGKITYKL